MGSLSKNALEVLKRRYLKKIDGVVVEEPEDMFRRVADTIAKVDAQYGASTEEVELTANKFFEIMMNLDFLPNSPTLMNAGRELGQLSACFVLPVEDSMEGIFDAIKHAALIHKSGGGTGFSFSRLRPKGARVKSTGGVASGPISFMKVFNAATEAVKQGGTRRGANMGILRVDHPDIIEFISCKENNEEITNFNISIGITNAFMEAVDKGTEYSLIDPHTKDAVGTLDAREVFQLIVEHAWANGEPGVIFLDRLNEDNPTPLLGEIESTNPCGEQPLLPYEACNLGSINLSNFVKFENGKGTIDYKRLGEIVDLSIHFLDNVIDANVYPLPQIEELVKRNRKIGLGVMGFSDMLIKLCIPYNSEDALKIAEEVMQFIQEEGRKASIKIAEKRGTFPNFPKSIYDQGEKSLRLRNATITTIAPTGTISMIAGCSSGIEPLFAIAYVKNVMDGVELLEINPLFEDIAKTEGFYSNELMKQIAKHGSLDGINEVPKKYRDIFITAHQISPEWHVRLQAAFQKYTDNAVSKTINFANTATQDDVRNAFLLAYKLGCKGITVYRDGSREVQVLNIGHEKKKENYDDKREIAPRKRPKVTVGITDKIITGCGNIYTTINSDDEGLCEVLIHLGKSGGCATSLVEAVARLISNGLRSGLDPKTIIKHLKGIRCPSPAPSYMNPTIGRPVYSCADAIAISLESYLTGATNIKINYDFNIPSEEPNEELGMDEINKTSGGVCPECGSVVKHESGCTTCILCGYSKCS
jgi:ribonucleoside-diphosphate reductase alpha chain